MVAKEILSSRLNHQSAMTFVIGHLLVIKEVATQVHQLLQQLGGKRQMLNARRRGEGGSTEHLQQEYQLFAHPNGAITWVVKI